MALAAMLWAKESRAQSVPPLCSGDVFQTGSSAIKGTMSDQLLGAALRRNAQIYGAANAVQTKLLPALNDEKRDAIILYDGTVTWGAMRVPFCPEKEPAGGYNLDEKPRMTKVDLSTVTMGVAGKYKDFVFYYAGSASMHSAAPEKNLMRVGLPFLTVGAFTYLPVGFFKREIVYDNISIIWDYIAGVQWHGPYGELALGYLGSKGLFTNLSERHIRAFAGAVLNDFADGTGLPYLAGGFQSLDWLIPKNITDTIGNTALSGRRLVYPSAPPPAVSSADAPSSIKQVMPFVTSYLEQTGIGDLVDVTLAAQYQPKFEPYEMTLAVHTPGYGKRPEKLDKNVYGKGGIRVVRRHGEAARPVVLWGAGRIQGPRGTRGDLPDGRAVPHLRARREQPGDPVGVPVCLQRGAAYDGTESVVGPPRERILRSATGECVHLEGTLPQNGCPRATSPRQMHAPERPPGRQSMPPSDPPTAKSVQLEVGVRILVGY